jgi:nucleoside-diphosphate-sugar epimerase
MPRVLQRTSAWTRAVITGGAGFIGTHLCRHLLAAGTHVVCVDNFLTSSPVNLGMLRAEPGFVLYEADVAEGLDIDGDVDLIVHLASPASPVDYQRYPVATLDAGRGTRNALQLAARTAPCGSPSGSSGCPGPAPGSSTFPCRKTTPWSGALTSLLAANALGGQPETSWREGLSETLDWFSAPREAGALDGTALEGSAADPREQRTVRRRDEGTRYQRDLPRPRDRAGRGRTGRRRR